MAPEKKFLLLVPGDATELLYFLIYIMKIIIVLSCVRNYFQIIGLLRPTGKGQK